MYPIITLGRRTFASLAIRNFRLYFIGQTISQCGAWMQIVALGWLVLQLTGSGVALGTVLAFRYFPQLVASPYAGVIVDRFDKRTTLYITQVAQALIALLTGVLTLTGVIQLPMIYALAVLLGLVVTVDSPARQTFVHDMVGPDYLRNAVTLNSTLNNLARAVGPLIAGIVIAAIGIAACFIINAISFLAVITMLVTMRANELHIEVRDKRDGGTFRESLHYVAGNATLRDILLIMSLIGTLSYEFQVSLPLVAQQVFSGSAADYAALLSAMGAGSVMGGLFAASREEVTKHELVISAMLFGVAMCVTSLLPTLGLSIAGMVFVGFFSINLTSVGNTMVQLESDGSMRGRVMSLWGMAIFGSTLIGGPLIGFVAQFLGARWSLGLGGIAALIGGIYGAYTLLEGDVWRLVPSFILIRSEEETDSEGQKV